MARRAARRLALPLKGPWFYEYGNLKEVLSPLRNWGKGIRLTRQTWERYTLADPTYPLRYCEVTWVTRTQRAPMAPKYVMSYYQGDKPTTQDAERTSWKRDWRVLRDDDLLLTLNRECMKALEERRQEEGWTEEDNKQQERREKEEKIENKNKLDKEMSVKLEEYMVRMEEMKKSRREGLVTFWRNQLDERKRKRSQAELDKGKDVEAQRDKDKDVEAQVDKEKGDVEKETGDAKLGKAETRNIGTKRENERERV